MALVPAACDESKVDTVDINKLTEASASLSLTIGDLVERYAAELAKGDTDQDVERLGTIFRDAEASLGTAEVRRRFSAAAADSRADGNDKTIAARQLLAAAALAGKAFDEPRPDYKPGDEAMLAEVAEYFSQGWIGKLRSTYGLHSGRWKISTPANLANDLADAAQLALLVAGYNYTAPDGSRLIRDRMRRLDMPLATGYFVDHSDNLALPDGDEPDDEIERFDEWRSPPEGAPWPNPLWAAVQGLDRSAITKWFEPAAEEAFE